MQRMSGQKKKRNHWVPQVYLRYFAADEARKKIWIFSKEAGDPALKPIEKVAVRFYLYAPGTAGYRDYAFEDKLADLERFMDHPVWRAAATDVVDLSDKHIRMMLSLVTAVMYLRNPAQLETSRQIHNSIRDLIASSETLPDAMEIGGKTYEVDKESWAEFRDADDEDTKRNWIKSVSEATWLAEIFLKMRWSMLVADEPLFITTDNPVTPIHSDLRFRGFNNPGTSVMFPLSPTRMLFLDHRHDEPDSQYYRAPGRAEAGNVLLWRNAMDHMYSSRDIDAVLQDLVSDADRQQSIWMRALRALRNALRRRRRWFGS